MAKDELKLNDVAVTDSAELTEKEKQELEREVEAEIIKEAKIEAKKAFKTATKQRIKKEKLFAQGKDDTGEDTELVLVTLASHTPFLRLDGSTYYPGRAYRLNRQRAAVLKEQMYRGELHDNEIHGKNMKDFYGQRPRNLSIGPNSPLPN